MNDSHIHVGQYFSIYSNPLAIKSFLDSVGVGRFAVSSTTTCNEDFHKVVDEIKRLKELCGDRVLPVLWVLPKMFKDVDNTLGVLMDSGIDWRCLKIHPQLHPEVWSKDDSPEMKWVIRLSRTLNCPILIHSGEMPGCYPSLFANTFKDNADRTFILAHGRPIKDTVDIMAVCPNVWVDTAFMPIDHIVELCKTGFVDRILWGTDYPIPKHFYPDMDMIDYYMGLVAELKRSVSEEDFEKITHKNFERLFGGVKGV